MKFMIVLIFICNIPDIYSLSCSEILELPPDKKWTLIELQTIPPKEIVECLAHLGKEQLPTDGADFIWQTIINFYGGIENIPDSVLMILHWVTPAVKPEDYANITLDNIDVIENFGLNYNLNNEQLAAIADRVREDFAGKEPEDYTYYDLVALKQILCQFNRSEIERIHPSAYREAALMVGKLENCGPEPLIGFASLAMDVSAFGSPVGWNESKMTTASVLMTVTTSWNVSNDKIDKECLAKAVKSYISEAAQEIRETPAIREQAVSIMRDWIQQNSDIRNVRQDDAFILRFLRQKKYSIPMAQQTLLKYLGLRKYYPDIFKNLDCEDAKMQDIFNNGYVAVSPVRDGKGRRVIVYNMSKFNASKYGCWDMCRAHILIYESLMCDPLDQMCGFTHVGDGSGVTSAHITSWNPTDFARLMKWGEQSIPMRHKEIHLTNVPAAIKYIVDFAASKVSPKMTERLNIHCNLKTLHKKIDVACLPKEFGGKIQFSEMIQYTKKMLSDRRQEVLDLDKMELLSTRGITSSRKTNGLTPGEGSVEGSFRKLEID